MHRLPARACKVVTIASGPLNGSDPTSSIARRKPSVARPLCPSFTRTFPRWVHASGDWVQARRKICVLRGLLVVCSGILHRGLFAAKRRIVGIQLNRLGIHFDRSFHDDTRYSSSSSPCHDTLAETCARCAGGFLRPTLNVRVRFASMYSRTSRHRPWRWRSSSSSSLLVVSYALFLLLVLHFTWSWLHG